MVSAPPTGQNNAEMSSRLTMASAIARHPANPQPPQLAPGSIFSTSSMRGSSSTLNFRATKYRITAERIPNTLSVRIVNNNTVILLFLLL